MTTSLAIVMLLGLLCNYLFTKIKLPGLLGMLLLGVLLGPSGLNWLDETLLAVSSDFRSLALIIILLRAGIGIGKEDLKRVGIPAVKLSFIPGLFEGLTIMALVVLLWGMNWIEGGILGFTLAAVSPAVVVPAMLKYMEMGFGKEKGVPTLILAGASADDVVAITIFSALLGMATGEKIGIGMKLLNIPLSIMLGMAVGAVVGWLLSHTFKKFHIRDTKKILIILGTAILLTSLEKALKSHIEIAGLIGVMTIGFMLLEKTPVQAKRLAVKLNKIWIFAEILLFVLVGAQVKVQVALDAGWIGILLIVVGLFARSVGVWLSLLGTALDGREKWFCIVAYWPKATVQAAIGAIPASLGLPYGDLFLAVAVMSILITAPIGAIAIQFFAPRCLKQG